MDENTNKGRSAPTLTDAATRVRRALINSLDRIVSETDVPYALILSGGVDTAAIVEAINQAVDSDGVDEKPVKIRPPTVMVTVLLEDATDTPYALTCGQRVGVRNSEHIVLKMVAEDLLRDRDLLNFCVTHLQSFDGMELRNTLVCAKALDHLTKTHPNVKMVLTGDGSDELLGGYSFFWGLDSATFELRRRQIRETWTFSTINLGRIKGLDVRSPYLTEEFIDVAMKSLTKADLIGEAWMEVQPLKEDQTTEGRIRHVTGKIPLREAFPKSPSRWRRKDPIELGSGSRVLSQAAYWDELVRRQDESTDGLPQQRTSAMNESWFISTLSRARDLYDANSTRKEAIIGTVPPGLIAPQTLRSLEHAFYLVVWVDVFGESGISEKLQGIDPCASCGHDLPRQSALFCRVCGSWPARKALLSFSSGKDSCWTLHLMHSGVRALWSCVTDPEDGNARVHVHQAVSERLLDQQATCTGLPMVKTVMPKSPDNKVYLRVTSDTLKVAIKEYEITSVLYGDIFLSDIVAWRRTTLRDLALDTGRGKEKPLHAVFPIYEDCDAAEKKQSSEGNPKQDDLKIRRIAYSGKLAREMIKGGLKAVVVVVDTEQVPKDMDILGKMWDLDMVKALEEAGLDPCGENGEFHTCCVEGPMFSKPVSWQHTGLVTAGGTGERFRYYHLDVKEDAREG
eukprot:Clim_evm14s227 gene=Clim_evmTU14s227